MTVQLFHGDSLIVLKNLPSDAVDCCVTSPPYWGLRDYGHADQIGLEKTPEEYVEKLVSVFREVRRILKPEGTLFLNLGDSYCNRGGDGRCGKTAIVGYTKSGCQKTISKMSIGLKLKDLVGIPWMVAFALRADGWHLRQDIIWHKPNPMPESVTDRCTKAHEYIFLLTKSARYFWDQGAVKEDAVVGCKDTDFLPTSKRNPRSVWTISTRPYSEAHFACFPPELPERCIKAGCPVGGTVLDPFGGSGTTGMVAERLGRNAIMIELNEEYTGLIRKRVEGDCPLFNQVEDMI